MTQPKRKQHRKGRRISRKLANFAAISEYKDREMCSGQGCFAELTEADYETGECTQCKTPIPKLVSLEKLLLESIQLKRRKTANGTRNGSLSDMQQ